MKNTLQKKSVLIYFILLSVFSCKAQQIYPLKTDYTEIPQNSYLKDIDNELNPYIGTWQANFNGNIITIFITKQDYKFFNGSKYKYYKDILSIKYIIKNISNTVVQDTQNMNFLPDQIKHTINSQWGENNGNKILFYYGGTNCGIGWGSIYLTKINSTQLSWEYIPNSTIMDSSKCPPGADTTIYLPETNNLVFTKQ